MPITTLYHFVFQLFLFQVQTFCANHSIDEVYNTKFLQVEEYVLEDLKTNIEELAGGAITILKLFLPKPEVPPLIAANYRKVFF